MDDLFLKGNTMTQKKAFLIYLSAALYTMITGFSFLFGKIALKHAAPMDILAHRFSAAFAALLITLLLNKNAWKFDRVKARKILPLATFYPLLFFGFQTYGLQYASSSEAGIIFAVIPIFTLILATVFLKERTSLIQKLCILVSVLGVIYISWRNGAALDFNNYRGILLLLISALSFAAYSILAKNLTRDFSNVELSYTMITISFICFNLLSILRHLTSGTLGDFFLPFFHVDFVIAILYLGILSSLVTALLTIYVLSNLDASKMSVFGNLATVISIFAGYLFLKEQITWHHIIGSALIVGGVLGVNFLGDGQHKH